MRQKKLGGLFLAVAVAFSCVRVRIAGFDRHAGTVTVCGNKWADDADLRREATQSCSWAKVVRCGEEIRGYYAATTGHGSAVAVPLHGTCCVYECHLP